MSVSVLLQTGTLKCTTNLGIFKFKQTDDMGRDLFEATGTQKGNKIEINKYTYQGHDIDKIEDETFVIKIDDREFRHAVETFNTFIGKLTSLCSSLDLNLWKY